MKKIIKERDDIVFFVKMFPLKSHTGAYEKSKAIVCAGSLEALDDAFADKPLPEPTCDSTEVDDNLALGDELGISSTPTIILPDGAIVPGYKDADTLMALITQAGDSMETEGAQEPPAGGTPEKTPEGGAEESQP